MENCVWEYDEDDGRYYTSCGNEFYFVDGDVEDNHFEYCPYCGAAIGITGKAIEQLYDMDRIYEMKQLYGIDEELCFIEQIPDIAVGKETGRIWAIRSGQQFKAGMEIVGCPYSDGYLRIQIGKKMWYKHDLVFLAVPGFLPPRVIHLNGNKQDNRPDNLKDAVVHELIGKPFTLSLMMRRGES